MNIGFVSTWLQRGAAYVTLNFIHWVTPQHRAFVFARGGEYFDVSFAPNLVPVHKGYRLGGTSINLTEFICWVRRNQLDMVIFNEQIDMRIVYQLKQRMPQILLGTYIDYYKANTIAHFSVYDFLICNTKRHYEVFKWHPQCLYLPWGVDTHLFHPILSKKQENKVRFFHSMGMSNRKGTEILLRVYKKYKFYEKNCCLIIHTQKDISHLISKQEAAELGITIICKNVDAPGLYQLGDIYVYPAKLDGLGLTMYEALACGLPVIATDVAPMNEVVSAQTGRLVGIARSFCREDGYYWPLSEVDEESLAAALQYYIDNASLIPQYSQICRRYAESHWDISLRKQPLLDFLDKVHQLPQQNNFQILASKLARQDKSLSRMLCERSLPDWVLSHIRQWLEMRKKQ